MLSYSASMVNSACATKILEESGTLVSHLKSREYYYFGSVSIHHIVKCVEGILQTVQRAD